MNVAQVLIEGAAREPGRPALVAGERLTSYAQLADRASRLAAGLRQLGLHRGDRVALLLPNCPELVEALWASFWGGFVAVPLNWHLHPDEVGYIVRHCGAAAIVVSAQTESAAQSLPAGILVLTVSPDQPLAGRAYASAFAETGAALAGTAADEPAWLFYTSGTTGRPKGATLSHRSLATMTASYYAEVDPVAGGSVFLHAAPLTHGSGLYLLPATGHGATSVIAPGHRFSAGGYLALAERHRVTHAAFLAPTMLKRVVSAAIAHRYDLSALRSIVVGGAPFYIEDLRAAVRALGPVIAQIYGQGEAPMTITVMPAADGLTREGSCGRPFRGVEVRIAGSGGEPLPEGLDGEVLARGDVVMSGYWNDPAATGAALAGGWLHTGDVGHLRDGYLYLTDRLKDVIITGGSNVYPREVEEVLLACPGVREVAVIGAPDPEWGESVVAFVVAGQPLEAQGLIDFCRGRMASFKKPRRVVFVPDLPKNAAGKVLKRQLREAPQLQPPGG
jgi:acyl-CoA synthetase (AMP-forming)/AMP-acid ligase II